MTHKQDAMRTLVVGAVGVGASFTLEKYSQWMGAISITLTALYMLFKYIDWLIAKRVAKHKATCDKHL
jgi:4-hydroxybenzoate polyprenyltransferase